MTEEELKQMAAQLARPSGAAGIEMAVMMNETNIGMSRTTIDALDLEANQKILEIGHGNCGHLSYLLSKKDGLHYQGLEISETMMQEASHINKEFVDKGNAAFNLYDGRNIPFADHSFDRCFTVNTIYFWKDRVRLLNEFNRVLKDGGSIAITFVQKSFMQDLPFTKHGFNLVSTEDVIGLVSASRLVFERIADQSEIVKTKAGEMVERQFSVAICSADH